MPINLGTLSASVTSSNGVEINHYSPSIDYAFNVGDKTRLSIFLHNQTEKAELQLWKDLNGNGTLDTTDSFITSSTSSLDHGISRLVSGGTYFAKITYFGSDDRMSFDLDFGVARNTVEVNETPLSFDNYFLSESNRFYTVQLTLDETRVIHANLHDISGDDNLNLTLYRDANYNGLYDADDIAAGAVASSTYTGNHDESLDVLALGGTYFVRVEHSNGSGNAVYDLDLSTTDDTGSSKYSNLLSKEVVVGIDYTFTDSLKNKDVTDTYYFNVEANYRKLIQLTETNEISNDSTIINADLRLIRDDNNNRIIDAGEQIAVSANTFGSTESLIVNNLGNYFLQVNQYSNFSPYSTNSPSINYQLSFESDFVG